MSHLHNQPKLHDPERGERILRRLAALAVISLTAGCILRLTTPVMTLEIDGSKMVCTAPAEK